STTTAAAAEGLCQPLGKIARLDVTQLIGEQPWRTAGGVDAIQPLLDLVQVTHLRGDHQYRIRVFQREEAQHPRAGRLAVLAEDLLQIGGDLFSLSGTDREHAHRHPGQPVDVEDLHGVQVVFQFLARATQGDDVASAVNIHDRV